MKEATHGNMTSMHFYGWKQGLKTGMYYLRTRPAADAIKFTVDTGILNSVDAPIKDKENSKAVVSGKPGMVAGKVEKTLIEKVVGMSLEDQVLACSIENPGACDMCSG
jgi:ribonucleotide reductase alpha subunit